jgi:hypothetical protein
MERVLTEKAIIITKKWRISEISSRKN